MEESLKKITFPCPHCERFMSIFADGQEESVSYNCPSCQNQITLRRLNQTQADACPACGTNKLYQHKDFNKKLGIILFLIGAVLAPWTYYLSLVIALAIDAALYPFFPWMQVCYNCHAELRGWPKNEELDRFNHEIAAHFEYKDNLKKT